MGVVMAWTGSGPELWSVMAEKGPRPEPGSWEVLKRGLNLGQGRAGMGPEPPASGQGRGGGLSQSSVQGRGGGLSQSSGQGRGQGLSLDQGRYWIGSSRNSKQGLGRGPNVGQDKDGAGAWAVARALGSGSLWKSLPMKIL